MTELTTLWLEIQTAYALVAGDHSLRVEVERDNTRAEIFWDDEGVTIYLSDHPTTEPVTLIVPAGQGQEE